MGRRYVGRSAEEVRQLFIDELGFREIKIPGTHEIVYEYNLKLEGRKGRFAIRAFTTVNPGKKTRRSGSDAGRVVVLDKKTGKVVWSAKRVLRTKGFLKNMAQRCREAYKAVHNLVRCPRCKNLMIIRKNSKNNHQFYGCIRFPLCRGTREFDKRRAS